MRNYSTLLHNVKLRSNPESKANLKAILEGFGMPYSDLSEYVKLSMVGVPEEYTQKSKAAANNVVSHLEKSHGSDVKFKRQGSIETNTHIFSENDIDVVQISKKSYTAEMSYAKLFLEDSSLSYTERATIKKNVDSFYEYKGDDLSDLYVIRVKSENVLQANYNDVDITKPKAICVNVKRPLRNVDVVTALEYRGLNFLKSDDEDYMGIQVYDKGKHTKLPVEFPFLSIKRINKKSSETGGRLKRMIRFTKNVKFDSVAIIGRKPNLSSFDINAICYDIPAIKYVGLNHIQLVIVIYDQLQKISSDQVYRDNLKSVDGQEYIFKYSPEKTNEVLALCSAIESILTDVKILNLV